MLSISSGHSADYLLDAVAAGRESYYTGAVAAGEPPGRWYGAGAESLGLTGLVDADVMRSVYGGFRDPRDPEGATVLGNAPRRYPNAETQLEKLRALEPDATPERLEELAAQAARMVRNNVSFHDATFSVPKSVTVLHAAFESQEVAARSAGDEVEAAAWASHRLAVEEAIWAGNRAAIDYLAMHSGYTRIGDHSTRSGRWTDAHDWTVASFFQHDSRTHDPQLHIHNAILNRVQTADGRWLTLSGKDLNLSRRAAGAMGERTMFEHLTTTLGVQVAMRPDGVSREIVGVDKRVMDHFSGRTRALTPKAAEIAREWEAKHGRAPNSLQQYRFKQQATLATRPAKEHTGQTSIERLERWDRELRAELGSDLAAEAHRVLALAATPPEPRPFSVSAVVELATAAAQAKNSRFTMSSLVAEIDAALPDYLGGLSSDDVHAMLRGLAEVAADSEHVLDLKPPGPGADSLPTEYRLANGESAFDQPESRLLATKEHVRSERALQAAAVERGAAAVSEEMAAAFVDELAELGIELGYDQRQAVMGVLTDGAKLSALVGAAGSGKSHVTGLLAKAWQDPSLWDGVQHRAFGLASSQVATEVLANEGLTALNVTRWLGTQQRLADGTARGDDATWVLQPGDLVMLDESAMAGHADIAAIRDRVEAAGGKTLLTGDHRQLASVGAGGSMGLVAGAGTSYELTEVRRFHTDWERGASLRLREGDPESLQEYRKHGRIVDGGTIEQAQAKAIRAFVADTLAGRDALLIGDTNEMAANLSAAVRADLVRLGRVQEDGVPVGSFGAFAGPGDVVQARRNAWDLAGLEGNRRGPINRERYTVKEVRADGGLVVDHVGERMTLPASYMQHVELGYASTVHSAQGLTVESSHVVTTSKTSPAGLYVGLSRGRDWNAAYVTTIAVPEDSPPGAAHDSVHRDPVAVLASVIDRPVQDRSAVEEAEEAEESAGSVMTAGERLSVVATQACAGRTAAMLDRLASEGALTEDQRRRLAADAGMVSLSTVLRQAEVAGHDPDAVLEAAVREKSLDGARSLVSVLHSRISDAVGLEPRGDSHSDWVPKVADPRWAQHVRDLARVADERAAELGAITAEEAPQWAVETLGPVPEEAAERKSWTDRAGTVAAHRELAGFGSDTEALPGPPARAQVEAYASWRAGWRALGRPEIDRVEREMSDGQLRMRIRAMERENAWQPPYVARELSGTAQAAERARETAEIRKAEAAMASNPADRELWEREAHEAAVLAASLADQARELKRADTVRGLWYAHTAETRAAEQRARVELSHRGVEVDQPDDVTTAQEWLEAHRAEAAVEDAHRDVRDAAEFTHVDRAHARDLDVLDGDVREGVETAVPDIRDVTAGEDRLAETLGEWTRVPDVGEVAEDVTRAQRALTELEQHRAALDARADLDERDRDSYSWGDAEEVLDADQYEPADG